MCTVAVSDWPLIMYCTCNVYCTTCPTAAVFIGYANVYSLGIIVSYSSSALVWCNKLCRQQYYYVDHYKNVGIDYFSQRLTKLPIVQLWYT